MAIKDIFQSTVIASCGLCCDDNKPLCDKCEEATLKGNGLPLKYKGDIHGLSKSGRYSELEKKINELREK